MITRDNALVQVDGVVFSQVLDVARAAYEVRDLERAVLNLPMTNIRTVMGRTPAWRPPSGPLSF